MYLRMANRFLTRVDKRALWKLGYNMGENPYSVADKFVAENELPGEP